MIDVKFIFTYCHIVLRKAG